MAFYAIGDIQGCYDELQYLLTSISFDPETDQLWCAGDLVARGNNSEKVLAYLYKLSQRHPNAVRTVLGNHDLHLLAIWYGKKKAKKSDKLDALLQHPDADKWISWLRQQPLFYHDTTLKMSMVHAGLAPSWTVQQAVELSNEISAKLQSDNVEHFLEKMYGNYPSRWDSTLTDEERLRCIVNFFTRTRILSWDQNDTQPPKPNGSLELSYKLGLRDIPKHHIAWFDYPNRATTNDPIVFGHWASLGGYSNDKTLFGLDTGCVWGGDLTALNLETLEFTQAPSGSGS